MNKEQELRPCPFCSRRLIMKDPVLRYWVHPLETQADADCAGSALQVSDNPVRIAAWNRRSSDEQAEVVAWMVVDWDKAYGPAGMRYLTRSEAEGNPDDWEPGEYEAFKQAMRGAIPLYRAPPAVAAGGVTEEMAKAALALLAAEDDRQDKLHDLLETIREQIRLHVAPEHRPDGLMTNIQNAVYAMRGRTRLMNDAALTAALAVGDEGMWEGWRPIDTARKDGTRVLGCNAKGVSIMQWTDADPPTPDNPGLDAGWLSIDDGGALPACPGFGTSEEMQPTHWMPLPTPPTTHGP